MGALGESTLLVGPCLTQAHLDERLSEDPTTTCDGRAMVDAVRGGPENFQERLNALHPTGLSWIPPPARACTQPRERTSSGEAGTPSGKNAQVHHLQVHHFPKSGAEEACCLITHRVIFTRRAGNIVAVRERVEFGECIRVVGRGAECFTELCHGKHWLRVGLPAHPACTQACEKCTCGPCSNARAPTCMWVRGRA